MSCWTNKLYPHQQEAINKIAPNKVGALFMDMGTGKTLTALHIFHHKLKNKRVSKLVWFCPVSAKHDIYNQILEQQNFYTCYQFNQQTNEHPPNADIYIVGTESISQSDRTYLLVNELIDKDTMLIVDESHYIKNHKSKRTKRIIRFGNRCPFKLILTGTPMGLGVEDLFSQIGFLSNKIFGYHSWREFESNHIIYRDNEFPKRVYKRLNEDYLIKSMDPYVFQVKKSECLKLKPKCKYQEKSELTQKERIKYIEIKHEVLYSDLMANNPTFGIFKLFANLHKYTCTQVSSKQPLLTGILKNIGVEKCIIWCSYLCEVDSLLSLLSNATELTGRVKDKEGALLEFETSTQFLIATYGSGSTGLNLTFCHNAIFYSNKFDALVRQQSEDRIYRIGQTHQVKIFDLIVDNTIDDIIYRCVENKKQLIAEFTNDLKALNNAKGKKEKEKILAEIDKKL